MFKSMLESCLDTTLRHRGDADPANQGRAKSRCPWLWSRTSVIQLEGERTTRARTGRFEVSAPQKKAPTESLGKNLACANLFIGLKHMIFFWGGRGIITANLHHYAMNMPLRTLAHHCKRLSPLLAAPAVLLLSQGQAKAVLTYNIFESGGNVVVQTSGSLNFTGATQDSTYSFGTNGAILSSLGLVNTGPNNNSSPAYVISGPNNFNGNVLAINGDSVSGIMTLLNASISKFSIDPTYVSTTPIVSSATFNGKTLASLGFTTTGLIGTWSLTGTSETINVFLGDPVSAAVPGPLPLLGAGFAFGWSRRLRKRIAAPLITPPQV
jgi:hypothetical protein